MTDSLYKGTGGHNYIQDEDSFVKKMQEETNNFVTRLGGDYIARKDFDTLTAQIIRNTCELIEQKLKELEKQNHDAKCQWSKPRGITASDYDCTDLHTGYAEALSDIREDIINNIQSHE